jgi:hypothetical protein
MEMKILLKKKQRRNVRQATDRQRHRQSHGDTYKCQRTKEAEAPKEEITERQIGKEKKSGWEVDRPTEGEKRV